MPRLIPEFFKEGQDAYASGLSFDIIANRAMQIETETRAAVNTAYKREPTNDSAIEHAEDMAENAFPSMILGFLDGFVASIRRIEAQMTASPPSVKV